MENIILGAGLTGLTTAHYSKLAGIPCRVFEASAEPGGAGASVQIRDTTFDLGVHIYYFTREEGKKLFKDLTGGHYLREEKQVKIQMEGFQVDYPYQANLHQLPREMRIQSLFDLLLTMQNKPKPKHFRDWLISTYGSSMATDFLIPHNEKLMQVPLERVTLKWAERFFPKPNLKEILAGSFAKGRDQFHPNQSFLYPQRGGAGMLTSVLSQRCPVSYGKKAILINTEDKELVFEDGETVLYDQLLSTIPLPDLLSMLRPKPPWADEILNRLIYSSIAIVMIRAKGRSHMSRSGIHWIYYPDPSVPFQRLSFTENYSPHNAPDGQTGICLECTLPAMKEVPKLLETEAVKMLDPMDICSRNSILSVQTRFLRYAYPLYHDGYEEDVRLVQDYLENQQIKTTGRYGLWKYSNMEDAMIWGMEASRWFELGYHLWNGKRLSLCLG
jgi:protoporphyrinogen oxidase